MRATAHTEQEQVKQRDLALLRAQKAMKKGDWEKALKCFRQAAGIKDSAKIDKAIFQLEEKLISKKFTQDHAYIKSCRKNDERFSRICSGLEENFSIWPVQQRVSLLLKNSCWKEASIYWPQVSPSLLDPVLVGRYYLQLGSPWQALMAWRQILRDGDGLTEKDRNSLVEAISALFVCAPYPLVEDIDIKSLQWLSRHIPEDTFRTIACCHLAHFLYHGKWKKGMQRCDEFRKKFSGLEWKNEPIFMEIEASLHYWKIRSSYSHGPKEKLVQVKKILHGIGMDEDTNLYKHLLEFCCPGKDEMHWTALCESNPYQLIGLEKSATGQKEIMHLFNKAVEREAFDLRKMLAVQRVLRDPELQDVLKFLFLPI